MDWNRNDESDHICILNTKPKSWCLLLISTLSFTFFLMPCASLLLAPKTPMTHAWWESPSQATFLIVLSNNHQNLLKLSGLNFNNFLHHFYKYALSSEQSFISNNLSRGWVLSIAKVYLSIVTNTYMAQYIKS